MIELYTWGTPNGRKVSIMLEECGLDYRIHPIDIGLGDQFAPDFRAINPNGKIPVIVDDDGPEGQPITLFESGAILIYLAEKTGRFLPADPRGWFQVVQWLMWQMGGVGPMFGQAHHFRKFAPEPLSYAIERYTTETRRLYGVLEARLGASEFVAGPYSIADMAIYPWTTRHDWQGIDLADFPNVAAWSAKLAARPAVQKGMAVPG